jgi:hypothetical protein
LSHYSDDSEDDESEDDDELSEDECLFSSETCSSGGEDNFHEADDLLEKKKKKKNKNTLRTGDAGVGDPLIYYFFSFLFRLFIFTDSTTVPYSFCFPMDKGGG